MQKTVCPWVWPCASDTSKITCWVWRRGGLISMVCMIEKEYGDSNCPVIGSGLGPVLGSRVTLGAERRSLGHGEAFGHTGLDSRVLEFPPSPTSLLPGRGSEGVLLEPLELPQAHVISSCRAAEGLLSFGRSCPVGCSVRTRCAAGSLPLRAPLPQLSTAPVLASSLASRWVCWPGLRPLPGEPHLCQPPMPG